MCGFIASFGQDIKHKGFEDAIESLKRRGPDAKGIWSKDDVFLGSRRLAIFDLNERSNQPMKSICSRYILIFNGAIYNYKNLRKYLIESGIELKTFSDTEVILELFALEGPKMLHRLEGMFAFLIWDIENKEAFAARDPYGIKPLYIGSNSKGLILASQVKTLLATKQIETDKDIYSEFAFKNFGYVIEPNTWFNNIKSLKSGYYIIIRDRKIITEKKWFNIENFWVRADQANIKIPKNEYIKIINEAVTDSVKKHLVADVPIGIFLSGGIDSTLLASIVSSNSKKTITAITVLFDEFEDSNNDETSLAKKVTEKLGLKHHIFKVTKEDFYKDLPEILDAMDQPSIDGINTWYASKAAAKLNLKVVFSGLGGDEIFFGYDHYKKIPFLHKYLNLLKKIPFSKFILEIFLNFLSFMSKDLRWKFILKNSNSISKLWFLKRSILYSDDTSENKHEKSKLDLNDFYKEFLNKDLEYNFTDMKIHLSKLDSLFYMRNQLLRDSDWASMYHSIELRTPFVDIKLVEKLKDLMNSYSFHNNKDILKLSFQSILPKEILHKKKVGFQTPISKWYKSYSKKKNIPSKNYIYDYMADIKESFNKF